MLSIFSLSRSLACLFERMITELKIAMKWVITDQHQKWKMRLVLMLSCMHMHLTEPSQTELEPELLYAQYL